jgi:gamma-glutamyltranspeptidase/glutathione hydrolase
MVTEDDELAICYGVMGGFMQPQGHVQVLTNIVDHGMNVQRALDAPRFNYQRRDEYIIEPALAKTLYQSLERRGHTLEVTSQGNYGGGQVIRRDPDSGAWLAGSEPRKDGCAVAF